MREAEPEPIRVKRPNLRAHGAVLAAGVLFGSTFQVMKDAIDTAGPIPFIAVRFLIGALCLAPLALREPRQRGVVRAGVACGAALLVGYIFQTVGLQYTSASVSAFITYMLVVLVPVIAAVTVRRLPTTPTIAGVLLATAGLFLLTGRGVGLGRGELLTLGCAVAFAVHIVLLSEWSPTFSTAAAHRDPTWRSSASWPSSSGCSPAGTPSRPTSGWPPRTPASSSRPLAFALQVWGQRQIGPTRTALLLMIEPVAAAVFGYAAGDRLGAAGVVGALLILGGIIVAEVPALTERSIR